jgi:hypothetical protein
MNDVKPTSETFWWVTLALGAVDVGLLLLVWRFVGRELFLRLKWQVSAAAGVLYAVLWGVFASLLYWDLVYQYVLPGWSRWFLPLAYGVLFGLVAWGFWTLSLRLPGSPAVAFCLLGGLVSLVGHSVGIRRGLLRAPFLDQVSPASALAVGFVEFIVYWCAIVARRRHGA